MQSSQSSPMVEQLEKLSRALAVEYRRTAPLAQDFLTPEQIATWAEEGLAIGKNSFRSWEAATEYFRVTPQVLPSLRFQPFLQWARWGRFLSRDSAAIASSYFRASPGVIGHLRSEEIGSWARLGRRLYKGTWKSGLLACAFFEASPKLLNSLDLEQIEALVHFLDALSAKSYDVAAECLGLAVPVLQSTEPTDRKGLLSFAAALAESQWRDAKVCFEAGPRVLPRVEKGERGRFLALARRLARFSAADALSFYFEGSKSLSEVDLLVHAHLLTNAESLMSISPPAAIDFLRSAPAVLKRVRPMELDEWVQQGTRLLRENPDSGQAFFRLQSVSGLEYLTRLSTRIDLQEVREILRMYCHALTGMNLQILSTENLVQRSIGWTQVEQASTEGSAVYLPPYVDLEPSKVGNFSFYKVISTHQAGHLELGSFEFEFDRQGSVFPSHRFQLEASRPAIGPSTPTEIVSAEGPLSAEQVLVTTDLHRFYSLFDDRQLIGDLFMICEDARIDAQLKQQYKGLQGAYGAIQRKALDNRPDLKDLALREALMEVLVQVSLDRRAAFEAPEELYEQVLAALDVVDALQTLAATVEDTAEAALRLYQLAEAVPNYAQERDEPQQQMSPEQQQQQQRSSPSRLPQQGGSMAPRPSDGSEQREEQAYHSPQEVDFRGEFKPELVQVLARLRSKSDSDGEETADPGQLEQALREMLEQNPEVELPDLEEGQLKNSSGLFITNLAKEAQRPPQREAQRGRGSGIANQQPADSQQLDGDAKAFFYDEWDYRVRDYRPRWCLVREREIPEGSRDFFERTLRSYSQVVAQIRKQFELLNPEHFRKVTRLQDGEEFDLDAVIEDIVDRRSGNPPTDKVYWRRNKVERSVAVVFLLDMSASTAEDIDEARRRTRDWDDDPWDQGWPRTWHFRRPASENYRRIIDVEKESLVVLIKALETIGDTYGIYGFSGYGRDNVEFYVIKDIDAPLSEHVERKIDKIAPVRGTRMGPAIRHAITKLEKQDARTKVLFLISDGRPQDLGYGQDGTEKEYAIHDTHMALMEAKRKAITPFALTVDKAGHDYLKQMCDDMGYEVLADIEALPMRLPSLYRRLTR